MYEAVGIRITPEGELVVKKCSSSSSSSSSVPSEEEVKEIILVGEEVTVRPLF